MIYRAYLCFCLLASTLISSRSLADEFSYLTISSQAEPFQIIGHSNKGIITDILSEAIHGSDIQLKYYAYPFTRYIRTMHKGTHTNWISYGSPAWKEPAKARIQSKNLSNEKLFDVSHVLVIRHDSDFIFNSINDLFKITVVTLTGFNYPGVDKYLSNEKIEHIEVSSHKRALTIIENRRAVAFIAMKKRAMYSIKVDKFDPSVFKFINFSSVIPTYPIHLSYSDNVNNKTRHDIDTAIVSMKEAGRIDEIINFYLGQSKR
ncbi:ABC transporter substrate-binding protein [Shewanella sp. UCD-KL12]|uniref:ABC transporter substrate-binding protein n=1 Tax=Shewanella sp. UCD-KL12 TaxID=1917163 RepID=UPI0009710ABB|nr:ABC transporter substrate-binding protein [Shewanella sp. UCD-KL12]